MFVILDCFYLHLFVFFIFFFFHKEKGDIVYHSIQRLAGYSEPL